MSEEFRSRLEKALRHEPSEFPFRQSYESVKSLATSIEDWLVRPPAKRKVHVTVEPGFQTSKGQQLNVVLNHPEAKIRDTLFRVYLSPMGEISLDLHEEQLTPHVTLDEMQDRILEFLSEPENKNRMNMYRDLLCD